MVEIKQRNSKKEFSEFDLKIGTNLKKFQTVIHSRDGTKN